MNWPLMQEDTGMKCYGLCRPDLKDDDPDKWWVDEDGLFWAPLRSIAEFKLAYERHGVRKDTPVWRYEVREFHQ